MKTEIMYTIYNQRYPKGIFLQEKESIPFLLYINRETDCKLVFNGDLDYELNEGDLYPISETESRLIILKDSANNGNCLYFLESSTIHDMDSLKIAISYFEENFDENNEYHQEVKKTIAGFMKDR